MKDHILTDNDRRKLKKWIQTGQETQKTRNLFTDLRKSLPRLKDDMILILKIRTRLKDSGLYSYKENEMKK